MTKQNRTSKIKGMKRCPDCKGSGKCKTCDGHGETRIVKGRPKGNAFERAIARDMTEWTGMTCSRVPLSGGWNKKSGDITPKDPKDMVKFIFSVEAKNQEAFRSVMLPIAATASKDAGKTILPKLIAGWWKQCTGDAKRGKKIPLLVMTCANEPVWVMMESRVFTETGGIRRVSVAMRIGKLRVMLWKEFLNKEYGDVAVLLRGPR